MAPQLLQTQIAVIEFARNVLGLTDANSTEFAPATQHPAVVFMPEISTTHKGGTMRLGARRTVLQTVQCISAKLYQKETFIDERHRHRLDARVSWGGKESAGLPGRRRAEGRGVSWVGHQGGCKVRKVSWCRTRWAHFPGFWREEPLLSTELGLLARRGREGGGRSAHIDDAYSLRPVPQPQRPLSHGYQRIPSLSACV